MIVGLGSFKTVFNEEQESELVDYIKTMEARLFGLTTKELRLLANQLAKKNQQPPILSWFRLNV